MMLLLAGCGRWHQDWASIGAWAAVAFDILMMMMMKLLVNVRVKLVEGVGVSSLVRFVCPCPCPCRGEVVRAEVR